jgi:peptidoglycan hydrolase-like protein with peptidoglycan-binding domain
VTELEAYIRQFPNGLFVEIAKVRIAELKGTSQAEIAKKDDQPSERRSSPDSQQQALATVPPLPLPNAAMGPTEIAEAQRLLSGMGLFAGMADGKAGPRTREAIKAFQLSVGIAADGELSKGLMPQLHGPAPDRQVRAHALVTLAQQASRDHNVADALRLYSASVPLDPSNGSALIALGDMQRSLNNVDEARRWYSRAAQLGGLAKEEAARRLAILPQERPAPVTARNENRDASSAAIPQSNNLPSNSANPDTIDTERRQQPVAASSAPLPSARVTTQDSQYRNCRLASGQAGDEIRYNNSTGKVEMKDRLQHVWYMLDGSRLTPTGKVPYFGTNVSSFASGIPPSELIRMRDVMAAVQSNIDGNCK